MHKTGQKTSDGWFTGLARPMPCKSVKGFVTGKKNKKQDACAIWGAVRKPLEMAVTIKTHATQPILKSHRIKTQLCDHSTVQVDELSGQFTRCGNETPKRNAGLPQGNAQVLSRLADQPPAVVLETLTRHAVRMKKIDADIATVDHPIKHWPKHDDACSPVVKTLGDRPMTVAASVTMMGDSRVSKSECEFSAFWGPQPRQIATGGRFKLIGISKLGNLYLRTLLIHGMRSVLTHAKNLGSWVDGLSQQRLLPEAIVALVNKVAGTVWATQASELTYQKGFVNRPA